MNLLIKILLANLLVIFISQTFAQDCSAKLKIISDVDEVSIYINDQYAGSTARFETDVELGIYSVRVIENSNKWNTKSFSDTIEVTDCTEFTLNYYFNDDILLDTDPQNVYVFSNDSLLGYTPLYINQNFKSLLLEKPDYMSKEITINEINLTEKIKLDYNGEEIDGGFYGTTVFKILVGTAIALGAATAYFKLEADDRFEEYKITGDPELLNQTDRLDLISGISFVGLQINFGLIIYLFLSD
jgi:hypothetical protein